MTIDELALLEKLIDLKLKKMFAATQVVLEDDMDGSRIMGLMVPLENELERLRHKLIEKR